VDTFIIQLIASPFAAFVFDWGFSYQINNMIHVAEQDRGAGQEYRYTFGPKLKIAAMAGYLIPFHILTYLKTDRLSFIWIWFVGAVTFYLLVAYRSEVAKFRGTPFRLL
jgi:hypothetical protein